MAKIARKDLPAYVRKCWDLARKANQGNGGDFKGLRENELERLRFYAGDQWRREELTKRTNQQRPWLTINKCKPAVDQIEGDIRMNPPGPQCHPVGMGADGDTADIIEGLIRECEYRSGAKVAYATAGKYSAASGYGVLELATEYSGEREFSQRLVIQSVEDPNCVFFDPTARMANRQDAAWAGKLKMYSRIEYEQVFGKNRRVLKPRAMQAALGWIQEAIGVDGTLAQINEWTGGGTGDGPFFVCEFYMVEIERVKLRLYTDNIARYDDEEVPRGVRAKEGEEYVREVPKRTIVKHIVDALEHLDETEWIGSLIPLFPVLGPEVYIDGKLHRLSLISGAIDSQRALNYVATTATELAGLMPKSPWVGYKGQFDDPRWQTAQSEVWAYLEIQPTFATSETTGEQTLLPPPQRNQWEAPIQWLLALAAYFSDSIKAVTAIYDPSLGQQKGDQSGKAIEQLRSESNVGNFSYADNLHRAIEVMYDQMCCIFPKILDGPRVVTIVKPDSQHEVVQINQTFEGGKPPEGEKANNICLGEYSVRVTVGPSFQTRQDQALSMILDFLKVAPQVAGIPGVAANILRMVGEGNPQIEHIADLLAPPQQGEEATPAQLQAQLQQEQAKTQQLLQIAQEMKQKLDAQLPKVEADKFKAALDSLTKIRVAEITTSKDLDRAAADREAAQLETILGMAHDTATQAADQEHQQGMADKQAQAAAAQQDQAHQQTLEQQQQAADNAPEPAKQ